MSSFVDINGNPIYPSGWVFQGVQYPPRIFREWSDYSLSNIGIYRVEYQDIPIPPGKQIASYTYTIEGYVAIATPVFEDIPVYIPESVSRAQGKAALLNAGLLGMVENYIDSLTGEEKIRASLAFNETTEWRRDSPFLAQAASVLGLSEQQLDNLFLVASNIVL